MNNICDVVYIYKVFIQKILLELLIECATVNLYTYNHICISNNILNKIIFLFLYQYIKINIYNIKFC